MFSTLFADDRETLQTLLVNKRGALLLVRGSIVGAQSLPDSPRPQSLALGCPVRGGIDPFKVRWCVASPEVTGRGPRRGRARVARPRADVPRFPPTMLILRRCVARRLCGHIPARLRRAWYLVSRLPSARGLVIGLSLRASAKGMLPHPVWATVERRQRWMISRNDDGATSF